nr:site-specific integrase [Variovorax boronicumulans]
MTEGDNLAMLPTGVTLRGGVYQLRIGAPKDLQKHYGVDAWRGSLRTSDRDTAIRLGHAKIAELHDEFERRRAAERPVRILANAKLVEKIIQQMRHSVLEDDDINRASLHPLAHIPLDLADLGIAELSADRFERLDQVKDATQLFAASLAELASAGDYKLAKHYAAMATSDMGLPEVDWSDQVVLLAKVARALADIYQQVARRAAGELIETPPAPTAPTATTGEFGESAAANDEDAAATGGGSHSLEDVLPEWIRFRRAQTNAIQRTKYALKLLRESGQEVALEKITRRHGRDFHLWLTEDVRGLTDKTAKNHFDCIRTLLHVAEVELEWIPRNPWKGMELPQEDSVERPPWSPSELVTLTTAPLFQQYQLPTVARAGGSAAYWIPLIGLYSGARIGEIGQLEVADVMTDDDGAWLSIHERAEGSTLKTANSERMVAVHSELIRLGFLDYVKDLQDAGQVKLWPVIPRTESRSRGDNFSQWFGQYRRSLGVTERFPDFHSFRHNARQAMRDAGIDARLADAVTGHAPAGSTGDVVYARSVAPSSKRSAVAAISYPTIMLPRVYARGQR